MSKRFKYKNKKSQKTKDAYLSGKITAIDFIKIGNSEMKVDKRLQKGRKIAERAVKSAKIG